MKTPIWPWQWQSKTRIVRKYAKKHNIPYANAKAVKTTAADYKGLPIQRENENGN